MTQHPHSVPGTSGDAHPGTSGRSTSNTNRPARRQRIRGCGVPPNVWFAPHPDTHQTTEDSGAQTPDWVLAETIRQFTTPDQNYLVSHLAYPGCLGGKAGFEHKPGFVPPTDPIAAAEADFATRYALHVVTPVPSDGDCGGQRRWHGNTPAKAYVARLEYAIETARDRLVDGGIFAVLVPRPRPGSDFADDTGAVIGAVRDGGLDYLQHIAVVDAFIDDEGITPTLAEADLDAFYSARAAGLPVHARAHQDLLIFRKPEQDDDLD